MTTKYTLSPIKLIQIKLLSINLTRIKFNKISANLADLADLYEYIAQTQTISREGAM